MRLVLAVAGLVAGLASLLAAPQVLAQGPDVSGPEGAVETSRIARELDSYPLPVAPFGGPSPTVTLTGAVTWTAWRVPAEERTVTSVVQDYRKVLERKGFLPVLDCSGEACGGFDFRFEAALLPPPVMAMDVQDFAQISAERLNPLSYASVLISKVRNSIFVQIVTVVPQDPEFRLATAMGAGGDDGARRAPDPLPPSHGETTTAPDPTPTDGTGHGPADGSDPVVTDEVRADAPADGSANTPADSGAEARTDAPADEPTPAPAVTPDRGDQAGKEEGEDEGQNDSQDEGEDAGPAERDGAATTDDTDTPDTSDSAAEEAEAGDPSAVENLHGPSEAPEAAPGDDRLTGAPSPPDPRPAERGGTEEAESGSAADAPLLESLTRFGHVPVDGLAFESGGSALTEGSGPALDRMATMLTENPALRIAIVGHSDNRGPLRVNIAISQKRAEAVRRALIERGVAGDRMEARGVGYLAPRRSNETEEGRALNRRVELVLRQAE